MDARSCQTSTVAPAEPGVFPVVINIRCLGVFPIADIVWGSLQVGGAEELNYPLRKRATISRDRRCDQIIDLKLLFGLYTKELCAIDSAIYNCINLPIAEVRRYDYVIGHH